MTTTTYQNSYESTFLSRRRARRSSTFTQTKNVPSSGPLPATHSIHPTLPQYAPLLENVTNTDSSLANQNSTPSQSRFISAYQTPADTKTRTYTYCNTPREIQTHRTSLQSRRLNRRVSSAPNEDSGRKSSYRASTKQKPSSANSVLTPRSYSDEDSTTNTTTTTTTNNRNTNTTNNDFSSSIETNLDSKLSQQEKESFNDLKKQEKRTKVPELVQQRRRIFFLCHNSSPRSKQTPSPVHDNNYIEARKSPIIQTSLLNNTSPTNSINLNSLSNADSSDYSEAEMADSRALAAIIAQMQLDNDFLPSESSSKEQLMSELDLSKYDYIVTSPNDSQTIIVSPRTLQADEELASRIRFLQDYRKEMRLSANAGVPTLLVSMVSDMNTTMGGTGIDSELNLTLKHNTKETIKKPSPLDDDKAMESSLDNKFIPLCYDATLKRFYDPNTGEYYELI